MTDLVAKRYVKALLIDADAKAITKINKELSQISLAYGESKFNEIITSSEVKNDDKVNFVLSLNEKASTTVKNLIKLLGENKRLDIIPSIVEELENQLSIVNNNYTGVIYTNKKLKAADVKSIEGQFSKKFEVNLSLKQDVCDYDGIKVDIDGLGVEISFSKDRLRTQMIEHILKAV
jgi:F-type H+-transporting ATPase subunit delta